MRAKKTIIANVSRQQAEDAFVHYNINVSKLEECQAAMNAEITRAREKYDKPIGDLQAAQAEHFEVLQVYAEEHPELFEKKKSVEWTHGVFGFRTGTPKLKTRKGFTWASVLSLVKGLKPQYLRTVEELNKEQLIADREVLADEISGLGMEVVQDETFYVQPALQEVA